MKYCKNPAKFSSARFARRIFGTPRKILLGPQPGAPAEGIINLSRRGGRERHVRDTSQSGPRGDFFGVRQNMQKVQPGPRMEKSPRRTGAPGALFRERTARSLFSCRALRGPGGTFWKVLPGPRSGKRSPRGPCGEKCPRGPRAKKVSTPSLSGPRWHFRQSGPRGHFHFHDRILLAYMACAGILARGGMFARAGY